jgi:hydrogenase maturation protein HypF
VLNQYGIDPGEVRAWQDLDGSRGVPTAEEIAGVSSQLQTHLNCVFTTSTGRLFDAVSSILGICHQITYEAQAAMELEAHACNHEHQVNYTDVEDLIAALLDGVKNHCDVGCLAHEFHTGLAHILVEMLVATNPSSTTIGLTGGVIANRLLTREITTQLARHGFTTVTHHVVPANDGGLSLGQAYAGYLHLVN